MEKVYLLEVLISIVYSKGAGGSSVCVQDAQGLSFWVVWELNHDFESFGDHQGPMLKKGLVSVSFVVWRMVYYGLVDGIRRGAFQDSGWMI